MYKAVIFDFFDVIRTDAYRAWLDLHGYKREGRFQEVVEQMDHGHIKLEEFLQKLSIITGQSAQEIFAEMEDGAVVDHEVLEVAERLRRHYKVGLLSNAPSDFIRSLLKEHDLEKYFDEIVISSEVGMIKPSVEIFQLMLARLKVEPNQAIFIDDNQKNINGAEIAGIQGVLYTNAPNLNKDLEKLNIK
jgi:putative hydrolase of the HAD superfamily